MKAHELIEALAFVDADIKQAELRVRKYKQERAKIEARLLKLFAKGKIDTQRCGKLTAVCKETAFPSIKDYPKFVKFVVAKKAFDLFQKRVSATALKERTENGERVPGVEYFRRKYISVTKARG